MEQLTEALREWLRMGEESVDKEEQRNVRLGLPRRSSGDIEQSKVLLRRSAESCRPYLKYFLEDNSRRSAEELEEIANHLSPGSAHTGGLLTQIVRYRVAFSDPLLIASLIYHNWSGGKVGFQFLPDPAETDPLEYESEVTDLLEVISHGTGGDPLKILTGADADFFRSLPNHLTIYRGCAGIPAHRAGEGLCWTAKRDIAEWFAHRFDFEPKIVVSARVPKALAVFVRALEHEIIVRPGRFRAIKWRACGNPTMMWAPPR